jgi:hypothetical protein
MQEVQAVRPAQGVDQSIFMKRKHAGGAVKPAQRRSYLNFQALDKLGIKEINVQRKAPDLSLTHRCNHKKDTEVSKDEKIKSQNTMTMIQ